MNWKVRSATAYSKDNKSRLKQLTPVKSFTTNVSMATSTKPSCKTSSTPPPSPVNQAEALSYSDVVKKSTLYTSSPTQLPLEYKKKAVSQTGSLLPCSVKSNEPPTMATKAPNEPPTTATKAPATIVSKSPPRKPFSDLVNRCDGVSTSTGKVRELIPTKMLYSDAIQLGQTTSPSSLPGKLPTSTSQQQKASYSEQPDLQSALRDTQSNSDVSQSQGFTQNSSQRLHLNKTQRSDQRSQLPSQQCPNASSSMPRSTRVPEKYDSHLPNYMKLSTPHFTWGSTTANDFNTQINHAYNEIVHWRRNLFSVPSCAVGKEFVSELARLFQAYADSSEIESVAITAAMVMPHLLLQKTHKRSNYKENSACLVRRLGAWKAGDIDGLMKESKSIQQHICQSTRQRACYNTDNSSLTFAKFMKKGNVKAAQRLVSCQNGNGVLSLTDKISSTSNESVKDVLIEKHPEAAPIYYDAIVDSSLQAPSVHPVLFNQIDGVLIRNMALKSSGSAGPSGLDAYDWKRLTTNFQGHSRNLCNALAAVARRLSTEFIDPEGIKALVACRLIPLNKNPGVRPIGVCETVRRIIGKTILAVIKSEILSATGALQLCAGQNAGCEAAIHALNSLYLDDSTEAILLVDATNAFNSLNRQVALKNISLNCPAIFPILANTYRQPSALFVGGDILWSCEGTTQGDPLAMAMYALATIPLITKIHTDSTSQVWYADDASGGGKLSSIKAWWDSLTTHGPHYGYVPNSKKSWFVVKPELAHKARILFANTNISITTEGRRYLGGALGTSDFCKEFSENKVAEWVNEIDRLSIIARSQPQAAHSAFTHSTIGRWIFSLRSTQFSCDTLQPLESSIQNKLIPAILDRAPSNALERKLLSLPARLGGLGIVEPNSLASEFTNSQTITSPLVQKILQQRSDLEDTLHQQAQLKLSIHKQKQERQRTAANQIESQLSDPMKRSVTLAREKGASSWLTVIPLEEHGYSLHKSAFRDCLYLRYGWKPKFLPDQCPCGNNFNVNHALSCPTGGFPSIRHNEVRDIVGGLLGNVCHEVKTEPTLQPLSGETLPGRCSSNEDEARLDVLASGFWGDKFQKTYFDVRVFNANAPSYVNTAIASCYKRHEQEKKRKYEQRVRQVEQASFTPIVYSCTGGCSALTNTFIKRLASKLSEKHSTSYSTTMNWLRCRISFALLRASVMCIRGCREKPRYQTNTNILLAAAESGLVWSAD